MAFLKRLNVSSHSRSSSNTSGRTLQPHPETSRSAVIKPLPKIPVKSEKFASDATNSTDASSTISFPFDVFGSNSTQSSTPLSPSESYAALSEESRKTSAGSTNSLSSGKMIYSWDVTDPEQWSMQRVTAWFKFHDFDEQWILFFRRNHIYGKKFLQLLAHDNFNKYESFLSATKNSSYNRFQHLLKRTLEENVSNAHRRQRSNKSNDSRGSVDSIPRYLRRKSVASEPRISNNEAIQPRKGLDMGEDRGMATKNHSSAKNSSVLYRRSFISLRSTSNYNNRNDSNDDCKTLPAMKISIPPRPFSTIEASVTLSPSSTLKSQPSPLSPVNYTIFRRDHKSSSSDSSLFNNLSSSADDVMKGSNANSPQCEQQAVKKVPEIIQSPLRASPRYMDDKSKIWDKFKKKAEHHTPSRIKQFSGPRSSSSHHIQTLEESPDETPSYTRKSFGSITDSILPRKEPLILEQKYYPSKKSETVPNYILVTKDNRSFVPLNISNIKTSQQLKKSMASVLGINHKSFTVHLTDFGCKAGSAIPDDILRDIRERPLTNMQWKFYVNDQMKIQLRPMIEAHNIEPPFQNDMSCSKGTLQSAASSFISSNDDINSFSDITSIDEHGNVIGRRAYPQTPSHYYDQGASSKSPELDYWNIKGRQQDSTGSLNTVKARSTNKNQALPSAIDGLKKSSFKVIRKHSNAEIDFNKGRESPYVKPEFAPKREAPKPPLSGSQVSLASSSSIQSSLTDTKPLSLSPIKLQRQQTGIYVKKNQRPPPPINVGTSIAVDTKVTTSVSELSTPSDGVVSSYTPASSHVLVPKPYKGATNPIRKSSDESVVTNPVAHYIQNQRARKPRINTPLYSPPALTKRISSRRVVSSTFAADVFIENEVSFADAPELSDFDSDNSDSSDDIIWATGMAPKENSEKLETKSSDDSETLSVASVSKEEDDINLTRKMTLRPTAEVVYQNLEMFFPGTDLDKPILEGLTPPPSPEAVTNQADQVLTPISRSSTVSSTSSIRQSTPRPLITKRIENSQEVLTPVKNLKPLRRTKTIRTIAREASEARKNPHFKNIKRQNTKMWGTRVVELTDKRMVSINKSKNSKGEYREFAWIKGEIIGKGSFGAVYLGLNVTTGEMMAVKQVEVPKFGSQDQITVTNVEALISEVSTLKNLDHLNIVQYLGFENKNGIYSLFLEYVAGGSVGSLIRLYGHFDEQLIRFLTKQVLEGLAYLHRRGILHRDMKADNLLLDNNGVCKISDLGISRKSNNIYSNAEMTMRGTVFWMAPEMVDTTQGYSAKVDIWSLGCVVLEMFAGKRPWSNLEVVAAMFQIGKSKTAPPIPEKTLPLISKDGRVFIDDCFKIDPEKRPTADTLLSHPFCQVPQEFDFEKTDLYNFIKQNDKLNNSKLRMNSQE
ncbi:mitogen-activated protein kinase kinase kinase BCK1 Ecym_6344 [Eremothecium cymbalariae DBVPG|uniref:Protein kinase domain-containing protein n=1 Tax=Eremothecium cymbalariae (strain CBS 270.75 / DBVPG 7215 / KCTC 17166 / NRRL Y-17582) TaxID=931890 RepID=G8JUE0_ERECY|nr:hypothetical protein Ecym_6344 [Eremothecium cymbalariae DBVPG\